MLVKVLRQDKVMMLLLAPLLAGFVTRVSTPAIAMGPPPLNDEVPLTRDILRTGQKLLMTSLFKLPGMGGIDLVNINIHGPLFDFGRSDDSAVRALNERLAMIEKRLDGVVNPEILIYMSAIKQQIEIAKKQAETQDLMITIERERFTYDTEAVMRKPHYKFPDDNLVVIVADFSSGNPDEGREIADEIAVNLTELVKESGIACHILVGETKPGLIIRSEQMARDVGNSLPVNTEYVVIWGTMSPRTVGKYRPHITSCWKQGETTGTGVGLDLPIDASDMPFSSEPQERSREAFRRLIGVTCATIPNAYAAHEINLERTPNLKKYYDYLGADSDEVKYLKKEIGPLTQWTNNRLEWSKKQASSDKGLKRIAGISVDRPYPKTIYDEKDGSLLDLVAGPDGKPIPFNDKRLGDYICYMDVTETTNEQFLTFLNSTDPDGGQKDNKNVGGSPWLDISTNFADIEKSNGSFSMVPKYALYAKCPVIGVTWFAARDYCKWTGKELPTEKEWEVAAGRETTPLYPWGANTERPTTDGKGWNCTRPCGQNTIDRSRIGCLDMRGNAREWCADLIGNNAEYAVRGGGFDDTKPEDFDIKLSRQLPQVSHKRDVGFRGAIRFPIAK